MRIRFEFEYDVKRNIKSPSHGSSIQQVRTDWLGSDQQGVLRCETSNVQCASPASHCSDVQQQTTTSQPQQQHWAATGQQQQRPNSSRCCSEANCSIVKDAGGGGCWCWGLLIKTVIRRQTDRDNTFCNELSADGNPNLEFSCLVCKIRQSSKKREDSLKILKFLKPF